MGSGGGFANPFGGGGIMGGALGPVLGSQKPRQTPQQYSLFDPNTGVQPYATQLRGYIENQIGGGGVGGISAGPNPFVGAGPQQQGSLNAPENWYKQASPSFDLGQRQLDKTISGGYLDPMQTEGFKRLSDARGSLAQMMFRDAMGDTNARMVAAGSPYSSSARIAQLGRRGEDISTKAAQDVAQAGWAQYGAERGYQDAAMRYGTQLAPGLAGQVFAGGEQLRGAEQQANTAHMQAQIEAQRGTIEAQLRSRGFDQAAINQYIDLLKMSQMRPISHIVGKSPYEQNLAAVETAGSLMGGMKGM